MQCWRGFGRFCAGKKFKEKIVLVIRSWILAALYAAMLYPGGNIVKTIGDGVLSSVPGGPCGNTWNNGISPSRPPRGGGEVE